MVHCKGACYSLYHNTDLRLGDDDNATQAQVQHSAVPKLDNK